MYRYLFYRIYKWRVGKVSRFEAAELNATLLLSTLNLVAILVIIMFIDIIFKTDLFIFYAEHPEIYFSLIFINLIVNLFLFIYKDKYKKILIHFEDLNDNEKKIKNRILLSYIFFLVVLLLSNIIFH